jgi:multiple sugar transport system permease protein
MSATSSLPRSAPDPVNRGSQILRVARQGLTSLGVALVVLYCLLPFYWMTVTAFRRPSDRSDLSPVPTPVSLDNLKAVFQAAAGSERSLLSRLLGIESLFGQALINSVVVAGVTTLLTLIIGTIAAYTLARLDFPFKNAALAIIIATSMFPGISLIVPLLKLFTDINWINTYQAMIVPSLSFALPLAIWNLSVFFRQMPFELEQAAMCDGCTRGQAFRKIIIPLAAPGVFTTAIIAFIAAWNEFIIALSMVNKNEMRTATVAISLFTGAYRFDSPVGTQMAAGVVVTVPLVIVVLILQRRIIAGLSAGGLK